MKPPMKGYVLDTKVPRDKIVEKLTQILGFRDVLGSEKRLIIEALALYSKS